MDDKVYDRASDVDARDGVVVVDGPDAVAVQLTPEAAEETSFRLLDKALLAKGQQADRDRRAREIEERRRH